MSWQDVLKNNAIIINWGLHGFVAAWIMFDKKILSYDVPQVLIYGVLLASALFFNMLHADIVALQNKPQPVIVKPQQFPTEDDFYRQPQQPKREAPFSQEFR